MDEDDETSHVYDVSHPHRIPLVPRRPTSSEGFFPIPTPAGDKRDAKGTKSRAGKGKKEEKAAPSTSAEEAQESPQPPADPDERVRLQFILSPFSIGDAPYTCLLCLKS